MGSAARYQRYAAGISVSLVGLVLLSVPVYDIWDDTADLSWHLSTTLVENAAFVLLASTLVVGGGTLVRSEWPIAQVTTVAKRTLAGALVATLLVGWAIVVQEWAMHDLKPYVIALDGVLVATVIAFGLGLYTAKSRVAERELRRERGMTGYLESLHHHASEMEDAEDHEAAYCTALDAIEGTLSPLGAQVVVDGEPVATRGFIEGLSDPAATAIGDRGRLDVFGDEPAPYEQEALNLLATHLDRTLARLDREQELREEHQLLEFVNRRARHDLLNDINLVRSRIDLVEQEGTVDSEHWDIVVDRVDEMLEFVETMRAYIGTVVEGDHEFEAISLPPVLREEARKASDIDTDAEVTVGAVPDVQVRADELLDSVFENLLRNAVEHNDKPVPKVRVSAERHDDTVVVRVVDNGPGIPSEHKEVIFDRGEQGPDSSGSGFGLSLVDDVVAAYGGSVEVRDNYPDGSVFVVELPLTEFQPSGRPTDEMTQNI